MGIVLEVAHSYSNKIFKMSHVFFERDTFLFIGETKQEVSANNADVRVLENVRPIPDSAFPAHDFDFYGEPFSVVPNSYYLRRPSLMNFIFGEAAMLTSFESEATVLRSIRRKPHKNLALPVGAFVRRGRVFGFVFERYQRTLLDVIKSKNLQWDSIFASVERGLTHLHSLGLCHNDVHVGNVMLDEQNRAVLIDFEFAAAPGTKLPTIGKTASIEGDMMSLERMKCESAIVRED